VRLASVNLLHGRSLTDGLVDGGRLGAALAALEADVLGLQEVDRGQDRSGGLDLTALVAGAVGAVDCRFEPAIVGTPGGQWRAAHDGDRAGSVQPMYGVALVSRLPVRSWHPLRLAAAPVRSPVLVPGGGRRVMLLADEPRVGLAAVLDTPAGPLTVATTHLSFVPGWNVRQLRRLVRFLSRLPAPRILLGDLNLPAGIPRLTSRWTPLIAAKTYPAGAPWVQLDHILADGGPPAVLGGRAVPMPFSDHRALLVDLAERETVLR
jgi:endonuclease/exonuclease/phosphatase family metal-dependent hydrolase